LYSHVPNNCPKSQNLFIAKNGKEAFMKLAKKYDDSDVDFTCSAWKFNYIRFYDQLLNCHTLKDPSQIAN
jgi:hypothetical protein